MKALIIGGGVGGLSTAIALRHIGLDVLVFEQAAQIREVGAGLLLLPNGMTALRKLGVADDTRAAAAPLRAAQIRSWRGDILSNLDVAEIAAKTGEDSVGIHRADLLNLPSASTSSTEPSRAGLLLSKT